MFLLFYVMTCPHIQLWMDGATPNVHFINYEHPSSTC